MSTPEATKREKSEDSDLSERLRFAERCFVNTQELTRLMDQKAGFLIAAIGVLTAALAALGKDVILATGYIGWAQTVRLIAVALSTFYLVAAFAIMYAAVRVFGASPNQLNPSSHAPGMMFPLMLLSRFAKDEGNYLVKLRECDSADFLADYSNQILEISNIYQFKHQRINHCMRLFRAVSIIWLAALLALFCAAVLNGS